MKVVLQDGIKDCGVCCLLSIIRFYGGEVSKEYLRELTNTTKSGVSAYKLIEASRKLGFKADGLNGNFDQLERSNLPCIAHVIINRKYQHFIVIYEIDEKKEKILVMDPAKGKQNMSFSEFKLLTSNNYIFLKPIKKLPTISSKKKIKVTIINFIKNTKNYLPFIFVLTTTYFILNVLVAFHFKYLIEYSIKYNLSINILKISITLLIIYILKEVTSLIRNIMLIKWTQILDEKLTETTYEQLILLPYLYYKNRTTGEIISRMKDLNITKEFISKLVCSLTTDILTVVIFIILMFNLNKTLTIISITMTIILFISNILLIKPKKKRLIKYYKNQDSINNYLIETLASADTIKGIHTEIDTINKFKNKYKKFLESIYNMSRLEQIEIFIKNLIINFLTVILFGIGSNLVIENNITIGELMIYQSILNYYLYSIINIFNFFKEYHNYSLSLNRVEDLFTISKENFEGNGYYTMYNLKGNIEYANLTYAYNSHKLFNNLNLKIEYGEKILLCGPSGSGKSTLVKILMRYIEIPFGQVTINNIDINHYHIDKLRNNITYVSQQELLFTNSIYNNIIMNREVPEEKLEKISKLTLVDKIIEKDNLKYQALVEENGFNFSGGERQRIVLARALLKESDIYIFDEALNQIDIDNEKIILLNIFKYLKNKTIIVISHRFNNQELFDRIININKGKIDEIKL